MQPHADYENIYEEYYYLMLARCSQPSYRYLHLTVCLTPLGQTGVWTCCCCVYLIAECQAWLGCNYREY